MLTNIEMKHWDSKWWRLKSFWFAMKFVWRNPRHVLIAFKMKNDGSGGYTTEMIYAGLTEYGFNKVVSDVSSSLIDMEKNLEGFKEILNKE